jgi:hypothetical protein
MTGYMMQASVIVFNIKYLFPTAPREVTVAGVGDTWCMLCWKSPLSGHSLGYLIWLHSNMTPVFRNVSVDKLGKKNNLLCTAVSDLRRWTDYSVQVAGWNKDEVGITSAPAPFNTRVNSKSRINVLSVCLRLFLFSSFSLFPDN